MKKKAHKIVHRYCDLGKAACQYKWGFTLAFFAWGIRWVVIFAIAARVLEKGDDLFDVFEKAYGIVTHSQSIWLIASFLIFHTVLGVLKWLGLAYGVIGFAEARKLA